MGMKKRYLNTKNNFPNGMWREYIHLLSSTSTIINRTRKNIYTLKIITKTSYEKSYEK